MGRRPSFPASEAELFLAADKLRGNLEPSEYKHVALGLIFLKYISDAFEALHARLEADDYADAEDPDQYLAERVFWVPKEARWSFLQASAKLPTIGKLIDDAMAAIETKNPNLKGVLPKEYGRPALNTLMIGELIDLVSNEGARRVLDAAAETADAVRGAAAGLGQTLRIGMTQIAAYQVVGKALTVFRIAQPLTRINLAENVTAKLEAALERRELDIAFLHPPLHAAGLSERLLVSVMRREAADTLPSRAEADTILGAILLAQAGYGAFAAPADFPHRELSARVATNEAEVLETSIAGAR